MPLKLEFRLGKFSEMGADMVLEDLLHDAGLDRHFGADFPADCGREVRCHQGRNPRWPRHPRVTLLASQPEHEGDGPVAVDQLTLLGITEGSESPAPADGASAPVHRRKGTKQVTLIAMLRAPDGATIEKIMAATGWQAHTVRGAMSGTLKKKLGLEVTSEKVENRGRVYRMPG
ncbi:DUF3489 domain-containing protein [Aurantimonas sp. C2-6-R+9]|uniref:DUF3489 domain-containing protein n=1 Tax=unclassified Aurantimonas TaxID=2638230 RepID=UPI002E19336A|nr:MULTISPECIES: DUF3489 domain-containing protein [unclassified Aurantimonas]MEC5291830.1 DUF3489 domain-containing protein [Aurantimonas sp. C2-3-R2]MEC5382413.1 DUF3489 domain-containing protein [Aurantimonas sp. C2-6-R+9]MEC5412883.1 DUF3489 domain-containing protein [Aurantimonas sp. C2-4-R8]